MRLATISMSPIRVKSIVSNERKHIAAHGVRVRWLTAAKSAGSECSFAMPYMSREVATRVMRTVFAVEKSAMMARRMNALVPSIAAATVASGALLVASSCQPIMLTAEMATRT